MEIYDFDMRKSTIQQLFHQTEFPKNILHTKIMLPKASTRHGLLRLLP